MLTDFRELHQQPSDKNDLHSLEHGSDKRSSQSRNLRKSTRKQKRTAKKSKKRLTTPFVYVAEAYDDFLGLWPNRFDYIYAPHPDPGTKPNWKTESSHPLPDRLILQGACLYGVRPGSQTSYALLDIDRGSPYHPKNKPFALRRICEALERLGLVSHLPLISSDSDGLHIYFPLDAPLPSWQLALGITAVLENAGFKIKAGWLEVFPNRKPFATNGNISNFQGHRLPLQPGSHLLNDDLQPIASSQEIFVHQWHLAAAHNDINLDTLEQTIKQAKRHSYRITGKANKFINDLNAEVECGWTGKGQTNYILGRITMRSYIFGHVLYADAPLTGRALTDDIVRVAKSLPGYEEYCGHQHEIRKKAREWTRAIEESHYFHYGTGKALKLVDDGPTWNQKQALSARERIQQAIVALCKIDSFPEGATPRYTRLCEWGIGGSTLYKNKDLWHPKFISEQQRMLIIPPHPPVLQVREGAACALSAAPSVSTSLLGATGRNEPCDKVSGGSNEPENEPKLQTGRNEPCDKVSSGSEGVEDTQDKEQCGPPEQFALNVRWALQVRQAEQQARAVENRRRYDQDKQKRSQADYQLKLESWLVSGDLVLAAEARRILSRMDGGDRASPGSDEEEG